ncbi:MAG: hypothetical protein AAFN13_06515 [Bacteroidota bacterium]
MGSNNLMLIVFGVIISMIAFVVGMQMYRAHDRQSSFDRMTAESMRVASDVLLWKEKADAMGGGRDTPYFSRLSLDQLGYPKYDEVQQLGGTRYGFFGFDSVATEIPLMDYYSTDFPDLRIQVRFNGSGGKCIQIRRAINAQEDGSGTWDWVDLVDTPDVCEGW